ncbi:unnamed protein product [Phytomonas sp. Hart1]|nr:unnamed protein product [Phytomonas sp. Hart1]|eukprot:CCW71125.1 unnamed protein product [Phytomonas sp. isolate Hart1]
MDASQLTNPGVQSNIESLLMREFVLLRLRLIAVYVQVSLIALAHSSVVFLFIILTNITVIFKTINDGVKIISFIIKSPTLNAKARLCSTFVPR